MQATITDTPSLEGSPENIGSDAEMLAALAEVRRRRTWNYSFEDTEEGTPPDDEYEANDKEVEGQENILWNGNATTLAGVAARLEMILATSNSDRGIDRLWARHGFLAVYRRRDDLDLDEKQVATAIHELRQINWQQAAAEYEAAHQRFNAFLDLQELADTSEGPVADKLRDLLDRNYDIFTDHSACQALVRTPAPNLKGLATKIRFACREGYADDAMESALADVKCLLASSDGAVRPTDCYAEVA